MLGTVYLSLGPPESYAMQVTDNRNVTTNEANMAHTPIEESTYFGCKSRHLCCMKHEEMGMSDVGTVAQEKFLPLLHLLFTMQMLYFHPVKGLCASWASNYSWVCKATLSDQDLLFLVQVPGSSSYECHSQIPS